MLNAISPYTNKEGKLIISSTDKLSVILCAIVKAVTIAMYCFNVCLRNKSATKNSK
jgi:hypothetical protein